MASDFPLQLDIDYPEDSNRLTVLFRLILAIPILIVAALITASHSGIQTLAPAAMILFRQKYPRWLFDWNLMLTRFNARIGAYLLLLQDDYPSTDEEQSVHLDFPYPDVENDLNRWMPLFKWILAIPHYIVFILLLIGALIAVVVAWFAVLITGKMPPGLFDYLVGVMRYGTRIELYAFMLTTDEYPSFSINE
ncbi:MAG: DUF4389 domain-containing protein [Chloroflexi bacterium]|jgi:hypothetical protein|nr:DUF4389 domain-containing protein [Chloroflexota bacterium]MBT4074122.1 DUF4389 domain-containing protein [Chloroflexota bacterium]MBT4514338.1 DUF4389 domain-containing protein [Chloroflexota bacterium]MBT5319593.1 DUF4389 domain-containing protein [Chloroflexota bacterium]